MKRVVLVYNTEQAIIAKKKFSSKYDVPPKGEVIFLGEHNKTGNLVCVNVTDICYLYHTGVVEISCIITDKGDQCFFTTENGWSHPCKSMPK